MAQWHDDLRCLLGSCQCSAVTGPQQSSAECLEGDSWPCLGGAALHCRTLFTQHECVEQVAELGKLLDEAKATQQAAMGDKLVKFEALSQVDMVSTAHMKALAASTDPCPCCPRCLCMITGKSVPRCK